MGEKLINEIKMNQISLRESELELELENFILQGL